jgi:hypothetical protein
MSKKYLFLLFFLNGCHYKNSNCILSAKELLKEDSNKLYVAFKLKNVILGISDIGQDSIRKGAYYFNKDGNLMSYKFFKTENAYSYSEEYDKDGVIKSVEGKLIVDKRIKEVNLDSAFVKLYLFSLNRTYRRISVKINNGKDFNLSYKDDSIFSNMKVSSFGFKTTGLTRIDIYFNIQYDEDCVGKTNIFLDTLSILKNPHLGPILIN